MTEGGERVLVTGAAGALGSHVVGDLANEGLEVVAMDQKGGRVEDVPVQPVDLVDGEGVRGLMAGVSWVVHCAAAADGDQVPPGEFLRSNVWGTLSLCREALRAEVRKFVYVSSIQVIASEGVSEDWPMELPYLPLDGACAPNPRSGYAFSKATGEVLVRTILGEAGVQCQSLRFPWLVEAKPVGPWGRVLKPHHIREVRVVVHQAFSCLSFDDASRVILACLRADLPGYRTYLPAVSVVPRSELPRFLDRYYGEVPLKMPPGEMVSLVDLSDLQRDTGWTPRDVPDPLLPEDILGRFRRRFR